MSQEKKPDYKNAEKEALDLLNQFSYNNPPVNPIEIAKGLGIRVDFAIMKEEQARKDVSGFFDPANGAIVVNAEQQATRQFFTVAHELGHKILHGDKWLAESEEVLYRSYLETKDWREQEANFFAANLLLPKFMMDRYQKKYGLNEKDLDLWSGVFGVSREFMLNRWRFLYGK